MVIFLIGSPLSGKTTLALELAEKFKYSYFSTGDYARLNGMKMEKSISELDLSLNLDEMIRDKVLCVISLTAGNIIVDGFPRSADQINDIIQSGVKFKIVFVYTNPVIMYERANERKRDDNDIVSIVSGRAKASQKLYCTIKSMLGDNSVLFYDGQVDDVKILEEFVCGK